MHKYCDGWILQKIVSVDQNLCRYFIDQYFFAIFSFLTPHCIFKGTCLWRRIIYGQTILFDFAQILQDGFLWPKTVSSKGISLAAFRVRHTSMPVQNGRKITPYLASKTSVTAEHRSGIQTKRHITNIYSPLYSPITGRSLHFVKEPGDDSPKQLNFKAKIAQFQPHFLHQMQKPSFTFEAELGRRTCLQSSTICHSFSFSRFKDMNSVTRAKFHKYKSTQDGQNGVTQTSWSTTASRTNN